MTWIKLIMSLCLLALMAACATTDEPAGERQAGYDIAWTGSQKLVHRGKDSSPVIDLRDIEGPAGLFALGPLAGLRGEITVMDGTAYISRVEGDEITVDHGFGVDAPFLVYGNVGKWKEIPVRGDVRSIEDLENWLPDVARDAGIDPEAMSFPFKISTSASDVKYHIMSNTEPGYQVSGPNEELKRRFESRSESVTLLGVFSKNGGGVFTHMGQWTHIHVVIDDGGVAGHVDNAEIGADAVLYLPEG